MRQLSAKPGWLIGFLTALVLIMAACTGSDEGAGEEPTRDAPGNGETGDGATMVFGTSADPLVIDGILVSDPESLRVVDQLMEGLVGLVPGTTEIQPKLATDWVVSDDGLEYTFQLREGVTFHDGEPFNADAVCYNFDRWYTLPEEMRDADATYYYRQAFGGFEGSEEALYESCVARGEHDVVIRLRRPSASFISALALNSFSIASPAALEEFGANEGEIEQDGVFQPTGSYGREHPTGTGPFRFVEWRVGDQLTMERNPEYWGEVTGNIETLIFRPISDRSAQLEALQSGEIDGYDLVSPQDFQTIESDESLQLLDRPQFDVGYVGFNQTTQPLDDFEVRRAIAHAINRQAVVDELYAGWGEVAQEFQPPTLALGYSEDVPQYEYDPELARQILEDAGYQLPVEISLAFPTGTSRPYMLNPQANAQAIAGDLEEAGFSVQLNGASWTPDYLADVDNGNLGLYLLGWTGDFVDPDNFVGTFFQTETAQWGFDDPELQSLLDQAQRSTDDAARDELYQRAHNLIMETLPGLPYVHTTSALAFGARVEGYTPSPVSLEPFSIVSVNE